MPGFNFLQASPEERLIIILVLLGALTITGIAALVSKRRYKK